MLNSTTGSIAEKVKTAYDSLNKKVYEILRIEKNNEGGYDYLEDEIFNQIKKYDPTFLQLLIEHAFEEYLHNQLSTEYISRIKDLHDYVPTEDKFLRLTHYLNFRIFYLKNPDITNKYPVHITSFKSLKDKMEYLLKMDTMYNEKTNHNSEYTEECAFMFDFIKELDSQFINDLYTYILSLLDQIGDPTVRVFTIGEKIDKEYSDQLLNILHLRDIIFEHNYSLYKKEKAQEKEKTRTRVNPGNGELPFEI